MRLPLVFIAFMVAFAGCGSRSSHPMTGTSKPRSYNCPASIGDFLNITHDPATQLRSILRFPTTTVASSPTPSTPTGRMR